MMIADVSNGKSIIVRRCKQPARTWWCKVAIASLVLIFVVKVWLGFYPLWITNTEGNIMSWKANGTSSIAGGTTPSDNDLTSSTISPSNIGSPTQQSVITQTNGYYVNLTMDYSQLIYNLMSIIPITVTSATTVIILHHNDVSISSKPQISNHIDLSHTIRHQVLYAGSDHTSSSHHVHSYYYILLDNPLLPGRYYIGFNLTSKMTLQLAQHYTDPRTTLDRQVDVIIKLRLII